MSLLSLRHAVPLVVAAVLAGCAASTPAPTKKPVLRPTPPTQAARPAEPISPPVLQDAQPPRYYTAAEARSLERRNGYRVDRSLRASAVNERVKVLVMHYTGGDDDVSAKTLTGSHVSVHYMIPEHTGIFGGQPVVMQLAEEHERAWHAGVSNWKGRDNLNDTSIGIEMVNPGFTQTASGMLWHPFSESQIQQLIVLAKDIVARNNIAPTDVVAHSDIAPGRKMDPGPFFPWKRLADEGIGAWPDAETVARYRQRFDTMGLPSLGQVQAGLARYGYQVQVGGRMDDTFRRVVGAFQMHFRPANYDGTPDAETTAILFALLEKYQGPAVIQQVLGRMI